MANFKTKAQKKRALEAIWSKTTRLFTSGYEGGKNVFKANDVLAIEKILIRAHNRLK